MGFGRITAPGRKRVRESLTHDDEFLGAAIGANGQAIEIDATWEVIALRVASVEVEVLYTRSRRDHALGHAATGDVEHVDVRAARVLWECGAKYRAATEGIG